MSLQRVSVSDFIVVLSAARRVNPSISKNLKPRKVEDYENLCLFSDGKFCGFGIAGDGQIVSVFSAVKGNGSNLINMAIKEGGTWLRCSKSLEGYYSRFGFNVVDMDSEKVIMEVGK